MGSRAPPDHRRRPAPQCPDPDRSLQWGGADPLSPRSCRPRPRRDRPAPVGDRTGVRQRAEERQPRDLYVVANVALGVGRTPASDPDPDRARARDRRAHLGDRSHHRHRTPSSHQPRRACQRAAEPLPTPRLPPRPTAARRRQPRPAGRTGLDRRLQTTLNTARHAGQRASHPQPATPGQTPTNNSPSPSPGSPARSQRAPKRTPSALRSSTRCSTTPARSSPST